MPVELKVPEGGESITEVQIAHWRKSEGDRVDRDEIVVEIETDKASMELPAPSAGTLTRILKRAGDTVHVGDTIGVIDESAASSRPASGPAAKEKNESAPPAPAPSSPPPGKTATSAAPARRGDGADPRIMPAAQRVMSEHGLAPGDVEPTGPGGRILKEDALRRAEETPAAPAERGGDRQEEIVPMSLIRRRIASRLVEAQQQAALLTTFNEIDMTAVLDLRKQYQEAFQNRHRIKLGFMSFFVKAAIEALKEVPQVNAEVRNTDIVYRNYFDIGIAVGGGRGLVVPVIRDAQRLSFAAIEQAIADFAARARDNKLTLEELQGGTFTISNGGIYGSLLSTPIVNPPQSGILGLHAIQERPVARAGEVVIRPMMYVALTYDHRIVDGREAVTFLRRIKEAVEDPSRILLEA